MEKAYFNWSSGKDSALALYHAIKSNQYKVEYLFSAIAESKERIAMHEIGTGLLKRQADSIGIPLKLFRFDVNWAEDEYCSSMKKHIEEFKSHGITTALYGDIYLETLRNKRIKSCSKFKIKAGFPLWKRPTSELIREFIGLGFTAVITCIDNAVLPEEFLGKVIDDEFLKIYPKNADICGENGEYHSFVLDGPIFSCPVDYQIVRRYYVDYEEAGSYAPHRYCYLELK